MPYDPDSVEDTAGRATVRRRLATMIGLAVLPAVILSVADGARRYGRVATERDAAFVAAAQQDAQATRDFLMEMRAALWAVAANPSVANFDAPACDAHLRGIVQRRPIYRLVVVADAEGRVRCASQHTPPGLNLTEYPQTREFFETPRFDVTVRAVGMVSREQVLIASTPIVDDGATIGFVSISVSAGALRYFEAVNDGDGPALRAIVDADGTVLLGKPDTVDVTWLPADPGWPSWLGHRASTRIAESSDGQRRVFGLSPFLAGRAWLVSAAETGALYDEAILRVMPAIVAPLLMLAVAVGVSYVALDRLVLRHLVYLARLARVYGRGRLELQPRIAENAPAEIASLFGSIGSMADELATRQRDLRDSAEMNRLLLLEVYHRVRNNLQMIASLVNLQIGRADTEAERAALGRIGDRVHGLALVHEKLYASRGSDAVDLGVLIGDIATALGTAHGAARGEIALDLALDTEHAIVGPALATPLALFVNEALLNAIKHGAARDGTLTVGLTLRSGPDGALDLVITNDADADATPDDETPRQGALGLRLMESFARQLRGRFSYRRVDGRHVVRLAWWPPPVS